MFELYKRIWNATGRSQILLIILALAVAALAAVPLQYQKDIINGLGEAMSKQQLITLCAGYLGILLLNSGLKFVMNYRSSILSESVIQKIRKRIYNERDDYIASGADGRGKLVTIIAAEAEDVGKFAGEAIVSPVLQLGTLVSVTSYIAWTQPLLGLFLLGVIFPQAVIVLTLQRFVNERVRKRVKALRHATIEITNKDIKQTQQTILDDFDEIYETRRGIYAFKFSMKFALNVINGLGTVGILLLGGFLFMDGKTDIGSIVASLSALGRINDPWHELVAFYRQLSAVRIRFDLLLAK